MSSEVSPTFSFVRKSPVPRGIYCIWYTYVHVSGGKSVAPRPSTAPFKQHGPDAHLDHVEPLQRAVTLSTPDRAAIFKELSSHPSVAALAAKIGSARSLGGNAADHTTCTFHKRCHSAKTYTRKVLPALHYKLASAVIYVLLNGYIVPFAMGLCIAPYSLGDHLLLDSNPTSA